MLLDAIKDSIFPFRPSAKPLKRSSATIIKSLFGGSNTSGWNLFAYHIMEKNFKN